MDHTHVNSQGLRNKTWSSLQTHLHIEWGRLSLKIFTKKISQCDAEKDFTKFFGTHNKVFFFSDRKLVVTASPPRIP